MTTRNGILLAIALIVVLLIIIQLGCAKQSDDSIINTYAECMADPSTGIHFMAGSPTLAEAKAILVKELADGEQTIAEIQAAQKLFCEG